MLLLLEIPVLSLLLLELLSERSSKFVLGGQTGLTNPAPAGTTRLDTSSCRYSLITPGQLRLVLTPILLLLLLLPLEPAAGPLARG
jgi:hypothetical protein